MQCYVSPKPNIKVSAQPSTRLGILLLLSYRLSIHLATDVSRTRLRQSGWLRKQGVDSWIQEIFDPKKGYSKAHTFARGTPKAPPLPTEMWRKGKHIGHPHYIAQELLQDWAGLWTQPQHTTAIQLWKTIKAYAGRITDDLEQITMQDLERGFKML